jgi:hypothetical protein
MTTAAWTLIFLAALSHVCFLLFEAPQYGCALQGASCCTASRRGLAHTVEPAYGNLFRLVP